MKTTKKGWLVLISFILVLVIIACSCGSLGPSDGGIPTTPAVPPNGKSTQEVTGPETPSATPPANQSKVTSGPA